MAQLATKITEPAPATPGGAIDRAHLARMTFGDRGLECEVLALFDRQAGLLLARMQGGDVMTVQALAHTLKGSAASVGATGVVDAAAAVERAGNLAARKLAVGRLAGAIDAARATIASMLGAS
jgi:ribosomal protein L10